MTVYLYEASKIMKFAVSVSDCLNDIKKRRFDTETFDISCGNDSLMSADTAMGHLVHILQFEVEEPSVLMRKGDDSIGGKGPLKNENGQIIFEGMSIPPIDVDENYLQFDLLDGSGEMVGLGFIGGENSYVAIFFNSGASE